MADFQKAISEHKDLPEKKQIQAGQAIAGKMQPQHYEFLKLIASLVEKGEIDLIKPETFLHQDVYAKLSEADRSQVDRALVNVTDQTRRIYEFYRSKQTPDESPHLQTMIEHLFQMKERVENRYGDVYKF